MTSSLDMSGKLRKGDICIPNNSNSRIIEKRRLHGIRDDASFVIVGVKEEVVLAVKITDRALGKTVYNTKYSEQVVNLDFNHIVKIDKRFLVKINQKISLKDIDGMYKKRNNWINKTFISKGTHKEKKAEKKIENKKYIQIVSGGKFSPR